MTNTHTAVGRANYDCLTLDELRSQLGWHSEKVCSDGRMREELRMSRRELNRRLDQIEALHVVIAEREWGTETTAA
jgi:hypothetical protein